MKTLLECDQVLAAWESIEICHRRGQAALRDLDARYSEALRAYHGWEHIEDIFRKASVLGSLITNRRAFAFAGLWHDAAYRTWADDGSVYPDRLNVQESARLMFAETLPDMEPVERTAAHRMILATADHLNRTEEDEIYPGFRGDLDLFVDLDLSSLGASWPEFLSNWEKLRAEYSWAPTEAFEMGRIEFLKRFLAHRPIFRTRIGRLLWEDVAVSNITTKIAESNGPDARRRL